jgi:hypothetical protein
MSSPNILLLNDQHLSDAIADARERSAKALAQYVDAREELSQLQSIADLRRAQGGVIRVSAASIEEAESEAGIVSLPRRTA